MDRNIRGMDASQKSRSTIKLHHLCKKTVPILKLNVPWKNPRPILHLLSCLFPYYTPKQRPSCFAPSLRLRQLILINQNDQVLCFPIGYLVMNGSWKNDLCDSFCFLLMQIAPTRPTTSLKEAIDFRKAIANNRYCKRNIVTVCV